jgi:uncharacterized protein YjdB
MTHPPPRSAVRTALAALLLAGSALACSDAALPGPGDEAALRFTANVSGTPINTLVVEVTAPDIAPPLVYNLQAQNGTASGTIKMPPGQQRTITVRAYDTGGEVTHQGSVTLDVGPGQNPPVSIPLTSNAGHVPVTVTIADHSVEISPASATVAPGGTVQLSAVVVAATGDTVTAQVSWATLSPAVATVSQTGLVTGVAAGTVQIVATYGGVGGSSLVTVQ